MIGSSSASLFVDCRQQLAEGPVWHEGALWWVEIQSGRLCRNDPATLTTDTRLAGDKLGVALPASGGWWWVAREHDCGWLHWPSGTVLPAAAPNPPLPPSHRFNDGRCDPTGRPWVGTLDRRGSSGNCALYRANPGGSMQLMLPGVSLSNGLAWSGDGTRFFYIDTPTRRIDVFDFSTGIPVGRRTLVQFGADAGFPDGMTIDADDNLWVAMWGSSRIIHIHGVLGSVLHQVMLPASQVTSCTFGGSDNRTLFITTARENLDERALGREPYAGSIFCLETKVPGLPVVACSLSLPVTRL